MLPIGGKPVLQYILEELKQHDIREVTITVSYLWEQIADHFKDGKDLGMRIRYSLEKESLGTAGSVRKVRGYLDDTFLVVSGDIVTNINLSGLIKFHNKPGGIATIALSPVSDVSQYGIASLNENDRVTRFQEKPKPEETFSNLANMGIYVLEPDIFEYIEAGREIDFSKDVFPRILADDESIYGYTFDGYWIDIGTLEAYYQASLDVLLNGLNGFKIPERFDAVEIWTEDIENMKQERISDRGKCRKFH